MGGLPDRMKMEVIEPLRRPTCAELVGSDSFRSSDVCVFFSLSALFFNNSRLWLDMVKCVFCFFVCCFSALNDDHHAIDSWDDNGFR